MSTSTSSQPLSGSSVGLDVPNLPPQYATANVGFYTRGTESVPTSVTVGPDGALYVGELTGIPYPTGYASVIRIDPTSISTANSFDGKTPSGTPQVFASGFSEIQSLGFDNQGDMYVLEYLNSAGVYDPTKAPGSLPPSQLIKVAPDGVRTTISGDELKLGNYVLVNKATGDVYVSTNNATQTNGQVIRYHTDSKTGKVTHTTIATHLNNPRGMAFGPDGNLYVLEEGTGGSPTDKNAPVVPFIPGLVNDRGGYTASITKLDVTSPAGGQHRIYTGLPSFAEYNPVTGKSRILADGANGLTIKPDGTVYIASGGGLAPQTAAAIGPLAKGLEGVLKLDGLFGADPSKATYTPEFNSLKYSAANGQDGATTAFNTESNLNDIVTGNDGKLYAVDAARNVMYGLSSDGKTVESVTVMQKQPPVLTPPQFGAEVKAGLNPTAAYQAELASRTMEVKKTSLPNVPGQVSASMTANAGMAMPIVPVSATGGMTSTTATSAGTAKPASGASPGANTSMSTSLLPPHGEDTKSNSGPTPPGVNPTSGSSFPGPTDPISPPILANNPYAKYFDAFFGNFAPAAGNPLVLPAGQQGSYAVSNVISFGDRLADNGTYNALFTALKIPLSSTGAPYSAAGNFTDGPKWTTILAQTLGAQQTAAVTNFAYEDATAAPAANPLDPLNGLLDFKSQIALFKVADQTFKPTDLVTVTFGGNDFTPATPTFTSSTIPDAVDSIISGMKELAGLGAKHFLVTNSPDVTLAPLFSEPDFLKATGATQAEFQGRVNTFNADLSTALKTYQAQSGLDVKTLDLHSLFNGIVANPSAYGFSNVTQPILANPPTPGSKPSYNPKIVGQDPQVQHSSLFLDPYFDPTALGQTVVAQTATGILKS